MSNTFFFVSSALLLLAVATSVVESKPAWNELDNYSFAQYVRDFNKQYSSIREYSRRKMIFEEKMRQIRRHNRNSHSTYKKGVNKFTDQTKEEMKGLLGYNKRMAYNLDFQSALPFSLPETKVQLPPSIDWRDKGVITAVNDQGFCGSCWAFATTEEIESYWALAGGKLNVLSKQQVLDCTPNPDDCGGSGGCEGGTPEIIYDYLNSSSKLGMTSEEAYPYQMSDEPCHFNSSYPILAKVKGYVPLPSNQYTPIITALATVGPLVIAVDATSWGDYDSGVFDGCDGSTDLNHAVQLVGYGTDSDNGDYWLIRNSWGDGYGEQGYIRMKRDGANPPCGVDSNPQDGVGCNGGPATVTVCGECGLLYDVNYPVVNM